MLAELLDGVRLSGQASTKSQVLAALVLALRPAAAFNPSAQQVFSPVGKPLRISAQPTTAERRDPHGGSIVAKLIRSTTSLAVQTSRLARPLMTDKGGKFNASIATWAAGFAFEAYNQPSERDARWEKGADGIDVAFMSDDFAREVYSGILEVRLCEARDLEEQDDLAQKLVSGALRDPYAILALNEESEDGPKEGAIGLGRAVDRVRSSTVWSKSLIDQWKDGGNKGSIVWPDNETHYLYVKDPSRAQLALTVFDEEVLAEDIALGATSKHMADLLNPEGTAEERTWSGWIPLTWRPEETRDNAVMIGAVAGAAVAGPLGAAAGSFVGSLVKKPVKGELRLELKYTPLISEASLSSSSSGTTLSASSGTTLSAQSEQDQSKVKTAAVPTENRAEEEEQRLRAQREELLRQKQEAIDSDDFEAAAQVRDTLKEVDAKLQRLASAPSADDEAEEKHEDAEEESSWTPVLASGEAPRGGSEGVDWSVLAKRVGFFGKDEREGFELCCFLTHRDTSSEVAIWRKKNSRILVVAFRGTSDVLDVLTDINFVPTPLEQGYKDQKSDDPRKVHSGFFEAARSINRRLKELLVAACAGTPGEWELLVTGHSLGGALASLMAPDLIGKVDVSRGFKERPDASLWGQAQRLGKDLVSAFQEEVMQIQMPVFGRVAMYTFGAPRVGNSDFARYFDETFGPEAFRIVNGKDVVPRLPRDSNAAGALNLDYEHVGKTVLITEVTEEADGFDGFWIEGTSDEETCPLRDCSPLSNPFSSGKLLGDVSQQAVGFATQAWEKIDKAAKVKSRSQLKAAIAEAGAEFQRTRESITSRVKQVSSNPFEAVNMIGLDKDFVESEFQLAESLASGKAIEHHLEPSYFVAMTKALDASQRKDSA